MMIGTRKIPVEKTFVLLGLSIIVLAVILTTKASLDKVLIIVSDLRMTYFWLAFATIIPSFILNATRWYFVVRAAGYNLPFWRIFNVVTGSMTLAIIPGRVGDFARSYPLRNEIPVTQSIGTVLLEKIIDIWILLMYATIGLLLTHHYLYAALPFIGLLLAFPMLTIFHRLSGNFSHRHTFFEKINDAFAVYQQTKKRFPILLLAFASSAINWGLSMLQAYWLYIAVSSPVPFTAVCAFLPLAIFLGLLPLTLAGVGTRDYGLIHFFAPWATASQSLTVGLLYAFQAYGLLSVLGIPFLKGFFKEKTPVREI